jgi:hypothetical protein
VNALLIALVILHGGDGVTTVRNYHVGLSESNPLLPRNPAAIVAVGSAEVAGTVVALRSLARRQPRLAKAMAIAAIVVEGTAIGINLSAHARARR